MSGLVHVILLDTVAGLGVAGSIVPVAEGYARHYLFPRGLAALADAGTVKRTTNQQIHAASDTQQQIAELQAQASRLSGTELTIKAKRQAGEDIFGSITAGRLARELRQQAHLVLAAKDILLAAPIKRLGTYEVTLRLAPDVETEIKVVVEAEPDDVTKQDED